jgi:uncharacterized repeat protein (TIGR01451 family)
VRGTNTRESSTRRPFRRALGIVVAIGVVVSGLTLAPAIPASAAVVQWGTNSGTTPNYQATVNGDFVMAGNGVLACTGSALANNAGSCLNLHAASNNATQNVNDNFAMVHSNTVSGFTTNSSTANLTIPTGATVAKAFLTWSGNTGVYTGDTRALCAGFTTARGVATMPSGSATGYRTQPIQFKVGAAGTIVNVAPQSMLEDPTSQATSLYYSASADVTSAFAVGTGTALAISAGNIWTPTGAGCYAGWSLTVVYDFGTYIQGNANSVPHRVIYYEGHVREGQNDNPLTVAFNGFTAVDTGTRAGFTLFEGDRNITGDTAEYSRNGSTTYTEIDNSAGVEGNFGIGRAIGSTRYTQTADTTTFTNQSVDVTTSSLANVVQGDQTVNLRLSTSGDSYLLRNAILSVPTAGLQIVKTYDGTADVQARTSAEKATFTIRITNTGAGTLRNIVVTDDQSDCARALASLVLLPLQSTTYTCTATSASAATYVSTASVTGYTLIGNYLAEDADSTTVNLSSIALTKTSALAAGATGKLNDVLTYTFVATNNGSSPLTGVTVTDPLAGLSALSYTWPTATAGALAPGASVTATATYSLKQSDVDSGSIVNTASTTGTDSDGGIKPTATATRTTTIAPASTISVTKSGAFAAGGTGRVGDVINYSFTFTNTGNVTLTNVVLTDPLSGLSTPVVTWPGTAQTLIPGATATATASYTVKQTDVDAGSVKNTATVTGRTPAGATTTGTSGQVSMPTVASAPAMTTTKTGVASGNAGVGQTITYSFRITNTGNVTLTGAAITDPLAGLSSITVGTGSTGTLASIAPAQFVNLTATYTIKQSDVDAGSVKNIATATAKSPNNATITAASTQSVVNTAAANPQTTFTKSGSTPATGKAGDVITYTFTLTNSGNVTLTNATINDPLIGAANLTNVTGGTGTLASLAPGQNVIVTAPYTLKQSDVDAGAVANTATSSAKPPTGANVTRTAPATVPITPSGVLAVTKTASPTTGVAVGSTITYNFTVKNNGNVTLTQVALADPLAGLSNIVVTWPGTAGTLAPDATATATATYVVKQSDVDAGSVKNTATATAKTPAGATVTGTSGERTVTTVAATPQLTTLKQVASVSGTRNTGDVITYTFRVTNSGNVTVTNIVITDPLSGLSAITVTGGTGTVASLAPGQYVDATATYTIKQSDVNAGSVKNTATGSGKYGAANVTSSSGEITTNTVTASKSILTTKSGALATGATGRAGDTVNFTITIRNTGNVTLTSVSATDSLPGISALTYGTWPSGTANVLQPNQTVTATATYTLLQSDVDAGSVANTVTGTGTPPTGAATTHASSATVPVASGPAFTIAKSGSVTSGNGSVGDTMTFTFLVRNTGNVTLTNVVLTETLADVSALTVTGGTGTLASLAPNQTVTATATYVIKQADVNAGSVKNIANGTAKTPTNANVTAASNQASVSTVAAAPAITTTKVASPASGAAAGSTITYTFTARNTGNVTLTDIAITDPLAGLSTISVTGGTGSLATLAPNQTVIAQATYVVKQSDVDSGAVRNTASSSGKYGTTTVTGSSGAVVTPTVTGAPAITLAKDATTPATGKAGDVITYTFTATNTGNVTLSNVVITDPLTDLGTITVTGGTGSATALLPGRTVIATANYTLKQSDVDAGSVANTARVTGTPQTGAAVSATAPRTVNVTAAGSLTVVKTGAITSGNGTAGSVVTFTFTITNPGNVTISGITLTDNLAGLSTPAISWPGGNTGVLAPNATATGTATYTLTQTDVDNGSVSNTASVSGKTPGGQTVTATPSTATVNAAAPVRTSTTVKSASVTSGARAGDVITYTLVVTNTGNRTLTAVTLTDNLAGLSPLSISWPGASGTLLPSQFVTARATYVVTQADVDNGSITNRGSSTGTSAGSATPVTSSSADVVVTTVTPIRTISLAKSGALASGSSSRVGDLITYTFTLRNTGNVTITNASITDPLSGLSAITVTGGTGSLASLAPNQTVIAQATYALKQTDVDAGSVANTASASGTPPTGPAATAQSSATVPLASGPAITVTKTGSVTSGTGKVGDTITFDFVVRNTGNVTLKAVGVTDTLVGLSALTYVWPGTAEQLAPNTQATATATYVIKQSDVNAGSVKNQATASGTPPTGAAVTATSALVSVATVAAAPQLTTNKTAVVSGTGAVNDVITYTIVGRNTGNVTLTGVTLTDPLLGLQSSNLQWSGTAGTLQPNETVSVIATYTIQQSDVNAGAVSNTATTRGTTPGGAVLDAPSAKVVTPTAPAAPRITVDQVAALPNGSNGKAGDVITWTITLKNDGNVTLTGIGINDSLGGISPAAFGVWPGAPNVLQPGQSVIATATYTVKQSDVDAGSVSNTATGFGTTPTNTQTTGSDTDTVPLSTASSLTLGKTATYLSGGTGVVGDTIRYTFTATNTGNVTLTGVTVTDPRANLSAISYGTWPSGTVGTLLPGQFVTATADYIVRQADVNTGSVANTASVSGKPPAGPNTTANSQTVSINTVARSASIVATKTDAVPTTRAVGDVITYTLSAKNTGNVTLTGVSLVDTNPELTPLVYGSWPGGVSGTLPPGETVFATTTHTITQADVNAGSVLNTATASGTSQVTPTVTSAPASVTTTTAAAVTNYTFSKQGVFASGSTGVAGDRINYTFTATNSGNQTLTNVTMSDPMTGLSAITITWPTGGPAGTLQPGQSATGTAFYIITQADVDAGSVANTATSTAVRPGNVTITRTAPSTVLITATRAYTITKTATVNGAGGLNDTIDYVISLKNPGNVTLTNVTYTEALSPLTNVVASWPNGTTGVLPPGSTATITARYTITQTDVDNGSVTNTVTGTAQPPAGGAVLNATSGPVVTSTGAQRKELRTTKVANVTTGATLNQVITYSFTVTNTGNVTTTNVALVDPLLGAATPTLSSTTLAPGATATATATYTVTQADIDAGSVINSASANAETLTDGPVSSPTVSATTTTVAANPSILVSKSSTPADSAGDTVTWGFRILNDGNVTLTGITLTDSIAAATPTLPTSEASWPSGVVGRLNPGQFIDLASTSSIVSQADVDAGSLINTVSVTGTPARGAVARSTDVETVPLAPTPGISIVKSAVSPTPGTVGQIVEYSFEVVNEGNVTLTNVTIDDVLEGVSDVSYDDWDGNPAGTLAPGDTLLASATYPLTQDDVDHGFVDNSATVYGTPPAGGDPVDATDGERAFTAPPAPALTTTLTPNTAGPVAVGQVITYTYVVTNTGNTTVDATTISDTLGLGPLNYAAWPRGVEGLLLPNDVITATATYTVTQADVDAGFVRNTATGGGTSSFPAASVSDESPLSDIPTVAPITTIEVTKTGTLADGSQGVANDTIDYVLTLKNTGNVTLTNVDFTDTLGGLTPLVYDWESGIDNTLLPGQTVTATTSYVISQDDVDAGSVVNTATGTGTPPGTTVAITEDGTSTVPLGQRAELTAVKTGVLRPNQLGQVGDIIDYEVVVTNTGNVTVHDGTLLDPLPGITIPVVEWPRPGVANEGIVGPGERAIGRASYALTQADIDLGYISNTADVGAKSPNSTVLDVFATTNTVIINTVLPSPALTVTKTSAILTPADPDAPGNIGDVITYTFTIKNTGNVSIDGVTLTDPNANVTPLPWAGANTAHTLAPNESITTTGTYTIDQDDLNAGDVRNTATADGFTPKDVAVTGSSAEVVTSVVAADPEISVEKTGELETGAAGVEGDTVEFEFDITNTGNVRLSGVALQDALPELYDLVFDEWNNGALADGTLDPGHTAHATAKYDLTQADVDAGSVINTVTVVGNPPRGSAATGTDAATVSVDPTPALTVTKTGSLGSQSGKRGDTITYTFEIVNTGNVTLSGIVLSDSLAGVSTPSIDWGTNTPRILAAGASATATATYVITQADIEAGSVTNTATVDAVRPDGLSYSKASNAEVTTTATRTNVIDVRMTGAPDGNGSVGDVVRYNFQIENTGNTTLTGVTLSNDLTTPTIQWPGADGVLLPGQIAYGTGTYVITQADVNRGYVTNSASTSGTSVVGIATDATGDLVTPTQAPSPTITVTKSGELAPGATGRKDDTVSWTLTLKNDGNVTLTNVSFTDTLFAVPAGSYVWPGTVGTLQPGQSVTAVVPYLLTQAQVDAGAVGSPVTGHAAPPTGPEITKVATASVPIAPITKLTVLKSAKILDGGVGEVGDVIEYTLRITNDSNVTIHNGLLVDPMEGLSTPEITWPDPLNPGVLLPGQTVVGVATYEIDQADVDEGVVTNTAHVSARTPANALITQDSNTVEVATVLPAPDVSVTKVGEYRVDGAVGDTIDYEFTVTNSGNVTLHDVMLADPLTGVSEIDVDWPGADGVLAPGDFAVANATYVITQDDVNAGAVVNLATATALSPDNFEVEKDSPPSTVSTAPIGAELSITDDGVLVNAGTQEVGSPVRWTYVLTNTGNVTLTNVSITETLPGASATTYIEWDGTATILKPGESVRATSTTPLTQAQIDAGRVDSIVNAVGTPPRGANVTTSGTAPVVIDSAPDMFVEKIGDMRGDGSVGDVIDYTFEITNTGNVTLSLIDIRDALQGVSNPVFDWNGGPEGILAPTQNVVATATYTVTQADVDAGQVVNIATASGKPPVGDTISVSSTTSTTTAAAPDPGLTVTKTGTTGANTGVGGIVTYTFTIENTGNVTLHGVTLDDDLAGLSVPDIRWPGEEGVLTPGGDPATATATYAIRQTDVDAGEVVNTATASGLTPKNASTTSPVVEEVTPTSAAGPDILVEKDGALAPGATGRKGDTVTYTFTITNVGNQTLTNVRLTDPMTGLSTLTYSRAGFPNGTLAPTQSVTATATYVLTQSDVDAGSVANTVTGVATAPDGDVLQETDPATVMLAATPTLVAVQTAVLRPGGIGLVGDWVDFELRITNTGNITLYDGTLLSPLPGLTPPVIVWPNPDYPGRVLPGETVVGTASVRLTQADVDLGYLANVAEVRAFTKDDPADPARLAVDATSNRVEVATVQAQPSVSITKNGIATGNKGVGQTVDYTFVITNTGNVTIGSIGVTDRLAGVTAPTINWPTLDETLAPGATVGATASYVITQADVDRGSISNIADVSAVAVRGGSITAASPESVVSTIAQTRTVEITNVGVLTTPGIQQAGDTVEWTYVFTNTGNVTLSTVSLTDHLGGFAAGDYTWTGNPDELAPGGQVTATRTQTLTQEDIDSGSVASVVTGSGKPLVGAAATATAPRTIALDADPSLSIVKTGAPANPAEIGLGDELEYEVVVTNLGNVTLRNLVLTDVLSGAVVTGTVWSGATGALEPDEFVTYSVSYTVQQEDIDRGSVTNTASVTAASPTATVGPVASNGVTIDLEEADPSITTVKGGSFVSGTGNTGSIIEFTFVVTNTGNVTLRLVDIIDDLQGVSKPVIDFPTTSNILAPGGIANGTARYTVTQADVDAGTITNTATSYGTAPDGTIVNGPSNSFDIDTAVAAPSIVTTHTAKLATGATGVLGDTMEYTFIVRNDGNVTLTGVDLTANTIPGLTITSYDWPTGTDGTLAAGQSVTITATRAVDQADVDRGVVLNVATGAGESPTGVAVSDDSPQSSVSLIMGTSRLETLKDGVVRAGGAAVVGSIIDYTFTVRNTGTLTVSGVTISDPKAGLSAIGDYEWPTAVEGVIPPGQEATATASYEVRQSDFDGGAVRNTATATGTPSRGATTVSDASPQSVVSTAAGAPDIQIVKTQELTTGATGKAGDVVQFRWVITNTGDVTLSGVTVSDGQARLGTITYQWPGDTGVLPVDGEAIATASYTLTQADVDAGRITSTATTSGTPPVGAAVSATDLGETLIDEAPAMTIDKTHTLATTAQQGGVVDYRIAIRNTGNVSLTSIDVTDALVGLSGLSYAWPGTIGTLAPNTTLVVTARYTITQADVDATTLSNTASATAQSPAGTVVPEVSDTDVLEIPSVAKISITITPSIMNGRPGYAGDTVLFTYVVKNTGTEPLSNVTITDPRTGLSTIVYLDWPGAVGVLLPGESVTATATYVVTKADEGTTLTETATVTSTDIANGDPVVSNTVGTVQLPTRPAAGPDSLSITGVDPALALSMSLGLLLSGLGLMFIGRKKRRKVAS